MNQLYGLTRDSEKQKRYQKLKVHQDWEKVIEMCLTRAHKVLPDWGPALRSYLNSVNPSLAAYSPAAMASFPGH